MLVLAAAGHHLWSTYRPSALAFTVRQPDPIEVPPDFQEAQALPAERGDLAGCNVLLVTIDTTRADRIGCYGNKKIQTPTLDRLAREGVIFSDATAVAPTTVPSHTSILTGLYPVHHGSRANGLYSLDKAQVTLAETLADKGYATAAIVSSYVLDSRFGLDQGFEHYEDDLSDGAKPHMYAYLERKADKTTARAVKRLHLLAEEKRPFFLWTHYFDPHAIYEPPSPYLEQYPGYPYDGEIAFVDAELGKVINALDELGLADRTLVVVVGDHGDSLGQHNEMTHAFLAYEATLRVPLIMRCGQRLGGRVHVSRRVSHVDLVPTILSLLGLDPPGQTDGVDLTVAPAGPRPIFAETLHGMLVFGWAAMTAVYDGSYKYIHGPNPELFDLSKDPNELTNVIDSDPERAASLKQELVNLFGSDLDMNNVAPPTETLSMSEIEKLGSLGYAATVANASNSGPRQDPKEMMPAMHLVERVVFAPRDELTSEKRIEMLEEIIQKYPDFHPAYRFLGDAYRLSEQVEKAEEVYTRCIEISPDPTSIWGLALTKLYLDKHEEAGALLTNIVSKWPDHLPARYFLGVLAMQDNRLDEAFEQFKYVFEMDPEFAQVGTQPCGLQLVRVAARAGRADALPGILKPKLEADPRSNNARSAMAAYYVTQKRFTEAEALMREGVALMPDNPAAVSNLAMFLVGCRDPKIRKPFEAIDMMERLCEKGGYKDPELLSALSVAYAVVGRNDEAIATAQKALTLAEASENQGLARGLRELVKKQKETKKTGRAPKTPFTIGD